MALFFCDRRCAVHSMNGFLRTTAVIDWNDPEVSAQAQRLRTGLDDPHSIARRCVEWVRDSIRHSTDDRLDVVTCGFNAVYSAAR